MHRRQKEKVNYSEITGEASEADFSPDVSEYEADHNKTGPSSVSSDTSSEPEPLKITSKAVKPSKKVMLKTAPIEVPASKNAIYLGLIDGSMYLDDPPAGATSSATWKNGMQYIYFKNGTVCETWFCCEICAWICHKPRGSSTANIVKHIDRHRYETYKLDRGQLARIISKATAIGKFTGSMSEVQAKKILPDSTNFDEGFLDKLLPATVVPKSDEVVADTDVGSLSDDKLQLKALEVIRSRKKLPNAELVAVKKNSKTTKATATTPAEMEDPTPAKLNATDLFLEQLGDQELDASAFMKGKFKTLMLEKSSSLLPFFSKKSVSCLKNQYISKNA